MKRIVRAVAVFTQIGTVFGLAAVVGAMLGFYGFGSAMLLLGIYAGGVSAHRALQEA